MDGLFNKILLRLPCLRKFVKQTATAAAISAKNNAIHEKIKERLFLLSRMKPEEKIAFCLSIKERKNPSKYVSKLI